MTCYVGYTNEGVKFFLCGDLGPHCSHCMDVCTFLCDYPVGDDKTCDKPLCTNHATEIGHDLHYCVAHHEAFKTFAASGGAIAHMAGSLVAAENAKMRPVIEAIAAANSVYELQKAKEEAVKVLGEIK